MHQTNRYSLNSYLLLLFAMNILLRIMHCDSYKMQSVCNAMSSRNLNSFHLKVYSNTVYGKNKYWPFAWIFYSLSSSFPPTISTYLFHICHFSYSLCVPLFCSIFRFNSPSNIFEMKDNNQHNAIWSNQQFCIFHPSAVHLVARLHKHSS